MLNKLWMLIRENYFITTVYIINTKMLSNLSCIVYIDLQRVTVGFWQEDLKKHWDYSINLL